MVVVVACDVCHGVSRLDGVAPGTEPVGISPDHTHTRARGGTRDEKGWKDDGAQREWMVDRRRRLSDHGMDARLGVVLRGDHAAGHRWRYDAREFDMVPFCQFVCACARVGGYGCVWESLQMQVGGWAYPVRERSIR